MHVQRTSATVTPADDKQVMLFDTYMILEQVFFLTYTIILLHHSPVSPRTSLLVATRDHGTEQTKSTEVIHNTQYVPQPSFTEEIHQQAPCGNRFLKA